MSLGTWLSKDLCDIYDIYFEKGSRAEEFAGSAGGPAHLCNDMGWIPIIGKLYKNPNAALWLSVKLWQKRSLGGSLFSLKICHRWLSAESGQGTNVIVTIVSVLPTDWTCCRLCKWQIWGQRDHICKLSAPFYSFVSICNIYFSFESL